MIKNIQCIGCIFYTSYKKCSVFSDKIPDKIWNGEHDHKEPFKGDGGITKELIV